MITNKWQKNFTHAVIYSLYVRPIISSAFIIVLVVVGLKYFIKDLLSAAFTLLAVLVFYAHFIDAKLDMLKRTLDEKSKCKDAKSLWIE
jgi:hypothetical protein